jgi:hypothetical protein
MTTKRQPPDVSPPSPNGNGPACTVRSLVLVHTMVPSLPVRTIGWTRKRCSHWRGLPSRLSLGSSGPQKQWHRCHCELCSYPSASVVTRGAHKIDQARSGHVAVRPRAGARSAEGPKEAPRAVCAACEPLTSSPTDAQSDTLGALLSTKAHVQPHTRARVHTRIVHIAHAYRAHKGFPPTLGSHASAVGKRLMRRSKHRSVAGLSCHTGTGAIAAVRHH